MSLIERLAAAKKLMATRGAAEQLTTASGPPKAHLDMAEHPRVRELIRATSEAKDMRTLFAEADTDGSHELTTEEFARFVRASTANPSSSAEPQTLKAWLDLAEAYRITEALKECRGNRSAAARLLGIGRRTLYAKMDKLGINPTWRVGI